LPASSDWYSAAVTRCCVTRGGSAAFTAVPSTARSRGSRPQRATRGRPCARRARAISGTFPGASRAGRAARPSWRISHLSPQPLAVDHSRQEPPSRLQTSHARYVCSRTDAFTGLPVPPTLAHVEGMNWNSPYEPAPTARGLSRDSAHLMHAACLSHHPGGCHPLGAALASVTATTIAARYTSRSRGASRCRSPFLPWGDASSPVRAAYGARCG